MNFHIPIGNADVYKYICNNVSGVSRNQDLELLYSIYLLT